MAASTNSLNQEASDMPSEELIKALRLFNNELPGKVEENKRLKEELLRKENLLKEKDNEVATLVEGKQRIEKELERVRAKLIYEQNSKESQRIKYEQQIKNLNEQNGKFQNGNGNESEISKMYKEIQRLKKDNLDLKSKLQKTSEQGNKSKPDFEEKHKTCKKLIANLRTQIFAKVSKLKGLSTTDTHSSYSTLQEEVLACQRSFRLFCEAQQQMISKWTGMADKLATLHEDFEKSKKALSTSFSTEPIINSANGSESIRSRSSSISMQKESSANNQEVVNNGSPCPSSEELPESHVAPAPTPEQTASSVNNSMSEHDRSTEVGASPFPIIESTYSLFIPSSPTTQNSPNNQLSGSNKETGNGNSSLPNSNDVESSMTTANTPLTGLGSSEADGSSSGSNQRKSDLPEPQIQSSCPPKRKNSEIPAEVPTKIRKSDQQQQHPPIYTSLVSCKYEDINVKHRRHDLSIVKEDEGIYSCFCGLSFYSLNTLAMHVQYFALEEKFSCDFCKEGEFEHFKDVIEHAGTYHPKEQVFGRRGCKSCGIMFATIKQCSQHRITIKLPDGSTKSVCPAEAKSILA